MSEITVVVPTCDRGPLLERAIDSVLAQTHRPSRIIVVDNGEQQTTAHLTDRLVEIIRTRPRIGPGRARNIGAERATTPLVAFIDDDDLWMPGFLEQALAAFADDPSLAAVVGHLERRRTDGTQGAYRKFPAEPEAQRAIYFRNPGFNGSFVIKRQIFLAMGGFDASLPSSEDRDLAARLLERGERIGVAPGAITVVCDHEGMRARHNLVRGNRRFIAKHWSAMRWNERWQATKILVKRWYRHPLTQKRTN
jgi:GT2 family glycosyltransferase